ncbi:MAG: hypothetical protein AABW47_01200 [Nanoarchaeota archaeon]
MKKGKNNLIKWIVVGIFVLAVLFIGFVSANQQINSNDQFIQNKMIMNLPELAGYTYGGMWEPYTNIDLRYMSPVDNQQHSEFSLDIYNENLSHSFLDAEVNRFKTLWSFSIKEINGNKIYEGISGAGKMRIWISGKNYISSWNGNDAGSVFDDALFNVLTNAYLVNYPSTYVPSGLILNEDKSKINEQVTCNFKNSNEIQKCYTVDNNFSCSGTKEKPSCNVEVFGDGGEELGWMSSCAGYNVTSLDGKDKTIIFDCTHSQQEDTGGGYVLAYYQCYNDSEYLNLKQIQETPSCKSYDTWKNAANKLCDNKCGSAQVETGKGTYKNETKCGVKSFAISQECQQGLFDRMINWFKKLFGG